MPTLSLTHENVTVRLRELAGNRARLVIDYPREAPYRDMIRAAVADLVRADPAEPLEIGADRNVADDKN